MPLINTARGEFWYADARKPGKIPLLLIHGAGASHLDYPGALRRSDHSTIAPDLCGHGKSPGEGRTTVRDYADDMVALLDALDIKQCIVAGHSMGGAIAQTLALEYPDRIAGLIIVASGAKLPVNDAILNGIVEKPEETAALIIKWAWAKPLPEETRTLAISRLLECPVKITQQDYAACNGFDMRDRLSDINAPALVIGGTADKMTPPAWSEFMAEQIPNATLRIIENGGHMLALEQPDLFIQHIETWLSEYFAE